MRSFIVSGKDELDKSNPTYYGKESTEMNPIGDYNPVIVGANFRKLREAVGVGQAEMAFQMGYSNNSQLSEFEAGKGGLTMEKLYQAVQILNVPAEAILTNEEHTEREARGIVAFWKMLGRGEGSRHYESVLSLLEDLEDQK